MNNKNFNKISDKKNSIYVMREDLLPFSFGGNKARKAEKFFEYILNEKINCVITYGSSSSNHCRIVANYCAKYKIKCIIISPRENKKITNNTILSNIFNAEIVYCELNEVKETIEKQKNIYILEGFKTYFIPGGGHGDLGTQAYVEAFQEILDFENQNNIKLDYIFHASGTGTTQAGLVVGKLVNNSKVKVVGISIARNESRGKPIIIESIEEYCKNKNIIEKINYEDIIFEDKYILEGYSMYNEEIKTLIKNIMCTEGIPLDLTYTGKAYWGMNNYIQENAIKNKNILFIHTGGTPIFFDNIRKDLL